MRELSAIRADIDRVDAAICALIDERAALAEEVAAYKAAHNLPVLDTARENEVLARAAERCKPDNADTVRAVFGELMSGSRILQQRRLDQ